LETPTSEKPEVWAQEIEILYDLSNSTLAGGDGAKVMQTWEGKINRAVKVASGRKARKLAR
jgi:hypothetical protein